MASELAKRLQAQRLNVANKLMALADEASEEGDRSFTAEETGQWESLNSELAAYDKRLASVLDGEKRAKETADSFNELDGRQEERGGRRESDQGTVDSDKARIEKLRAFCLGDEGAPKAYDLPVASPMQDIYDMRSQGLTRLEKRALVVGTTTAGGYTVPTDFYNRLMEHLIQVSAVLQAQPQVVNTTSGEPIQIPKTTAHPTAALVAEGGVIPENDPAFGQVTLNAYKYGVLLQLSRELIADTGIDLEGYLARSSGRAIGNAMGAAFILGTGSGQPQGIVPVASAGVTGGTGVVGVPTADNLIDLYYSVIPQYRNSESAMWMMADTTIAVLRKLKDSQNRYLWEPSLKLGVPDTFFGKKIVTDPNVAATGLNAKSVLFGDFSAYFIRFAGGVRFERSDDFAFNTDLVTFRAIMRGDGNLVDRTGAIKVFAGGAT